MAIGTIIVGPVGGLFLGAVFGITSFIQCFGADAFGTALFQINPVGTVIMCIPTRILAGFLPGLIFKAWYKRDKTRTVSFFVSALLCALFNTLFFMLALFLFFWNSDYIQNLAEGKNILAFFGVMVGINGLVEMVATSIVGGGVSKILTKVIRRTSDGEYV